MVFNKTYLSIYVISTSITSLPYNIYFAMAQSYLMTANDPFEQRKNLKAGAYTSGICLLLALFLVLVSFQLPEIAKPDPPLELQGIEVNLGVDETGMGDVQPLVQGAPAPDASTAQASVPETSPDDVNGDENEADNVPVVKKTDKPSPVKTAPTEVVKNPKPAVPKNVMKSPNSNGPGGNNSADNWNTKSTQGIKPGPGKDMGDPNGTPTSDKYGPGGGTGNNGIRMTGDLATRGTTYIPKLSTTESWRGTVAVRLTVDGSGNVISKSKEAKGTTPTLNSTAISYALEQAGKIKFKPSPNGAEVTGVVYIQFKY
jgi:periplasmic protein TonB